MARRVELYDAAACQKAVARTSDWVAHSLNERSMRDPHFVAFGMYKALAAFKAVGATAQTLALVKSLSDLSFATSEFHPCAGAVATSRVGARFSDIGSRAYLLALKRPLGLARTYRSAWFAAGTSIVGANELATPAIAHLETKIHERLGAVANNSTYLPDQAVYDLGSNACAVYALLTANRVEAAVRIGEFLSRQILDQPATATQICLAVDSSGKPIASERTGKIAKRIYFFDVGVEDQVYWPLGFLLRAFAQLFQVTRQPRWLVPPQRILRWLERSHSDAMSRITSAKLAWGAAHMFNATGDERWATVAQDAAEHIVKTQSANGIWKRPDLPAVLRQPMVVTVDTALERMFYLSEIPNLLDGFTEPSRPSQVSAPHR
mgnify:CR=1 FL=1